MKSACASFLLALAAVSGSPAFAQQQDFSKVEVRPTQLAANLYMLTGAGGNMALLVGADGAVLIDDQFAPMVPKIRAQVALLTDRPVRFVINTHWHFDHVGGNESFGASGSIIIAHENTRRRLSTRQIVDFFKVETPAAPAAALPVVTFQNGVSLHLNGEDISAEYAPNAHTDSDIILYFKTANVVHTGDVFTVGGYPFIDTGSGGSIDGVIAAADRVLARADAATRIIPGHGPLATRADLQQFRDMLVVVRGRVAALIRKGRTQQQVLDSAPTREFEDRFGKGLFKSDVWVQRVYVDLVRSLRPPRKAGSNWSVPNLTRVSKLLAARLMIEASLAVLPKQLKPSGRERARAASVKCRITCDSVDALNSTVL